MTVFSSQLLTTSASAYAGLASSLLLEQQPELETRYSPNAFGAWKTQLTQRLFELSAALDASEPKIFASRVQWTRKAFRAREQREDDLRHSLNALRQILSEQLPPMARPAVEEYLDLALETFDDPSMPEDLAVLNPQDPMDRRALQYLEACLEGDSARAIRQVEEALDDGVRLEDVYGGILVAAQREVGTLWHLGEANVAEEHLVTTTTERAMAVLAQRAPRRAAVGKTVLAAAVSGNRHGLGVRILSDLFEVAGWRSICLGADVPADDLRLSAVYFNADLVLLSAALPVHLSATREAIVALRSLPEQSLVILVGGSAFRETDDLWQRYGADGQANDIKAIVALGDRLLGLPEG